MSSDSPRRPMFYAYALLTGLLGGVALTHFFAQQQQGVSLPTVLMFTLLALTLSYLTAGVRIYTSPLSSDDPVAVPLEPEGMVLLGLTLACGPAAASWAALIVGLVTDVISPTSPSPISQRPLSATQVFTRAATALLDGGRNIIAVAVAWLAYQGVGGNPTAILADVYQTTAMGVLCVVYALVRHLWKLGASLTLGGAVGQRLETFLVELLPLVITPLIAVSFVNLGRQFFLLLALVLIGAAALLRHMNTALEATREQASIASFANLVRRSLDDAPKEVNALCALTHRLCSQVATASRFELGLFASGTMSGVHVKVAVEGEKRLPPMRLPLTPLWEWLSELDAPLLADEERLLSLSLELPPIGPDNAPVRSAMFVPIPAVPPGEGSDPSAPPLGAVVMMSTHPNAFTAGQLERVAIIAGQVGEALSDITPPPSRPGESGGKR